MRQGIANSFAAALLFLGNVALAQPVSQPSYSPEDLAAFHGDLDTLVRVVRKVERMTGGHVAEIRFTHARGRAGYHVVALSGGTALFLQLDEKSGRLSPFLWKKEPVRTLHWRSDINAHWIETAKISLAEAIVIAEQTEGSQPAVAAGIAPSAADPDDEAHAYNILIDHFGQVQRIGVDSSTGKVVAASLDRAAAP